MAGSFKYLDYSYIAPSSISVEDGVGKNCFVQAINYSELCTYDMQQLGQLDAIAVIRLVTSFLGLLGSLSIIISAIIRRRVLSSEVHPIFMLSVADCILDCLWILGGALWLANDHLDFPRVICYPVAVLTGILECVAVSLTVVYAIIAYFRINRTGLHTLLINSKPKPADIKCTWVLLMYLIAWVGPAIFILAAFGFTVRSNPFVISATQNCTCWCRPTVINVLPFDGNDINRTTGYMHAQYPFLVSGGCILILHYVVAFILLVVLYVLILRHIKKIKLQHEATLAANRYGATRAVLRRGQSQARKRVWLFLSVFVISGFFNLCSSVVLVSLVAVFLGHSLKDTNLSALVVVYYVVLYAQAITLPLQGFLNAMVYGWTRSDFISAVSLRLSQTAEDDNQIISEEDDPGNFENSSDHSLNRSRSQSRQSLIDDDNSE